MDGQPDVVDNCPAVANAQQTDTDNDGLGDLCDPSNNLDVDDDGIPNSSDNCPENSNPDQTDFDSDGIGDLCDVNSDNDPALNDNDCAPLNPAIHPEATEIDNGIDDDCNGIIDDVDSDQDGVPDESDNCPLVSNPGQSDSDNDGTGDACDDVNDNDVDGDGFLNELDNCPLIFNSSQQDFDGDEVGDACDNDDDNDGFADADDCGPTDAKINPDAIEIFNQIDDNCNGVVDDVDTDNDGVLDDVDNCPLNANPDQLDSDQDGLGDACDNSNDLDTDNDGILDVQDNCPLIPNQGQINSDSDSLGDACDNDDDNDGFADVNDCGPTDANINPDMQELFNGIDDNCNGLIDESNPTGFIDSVFTDDADSNFFTGTPPNPVGNLVLAPLTESSAPVFVIPGGSLELPVLANESFSTIYVQTNENGFFKIPLPSERRSDTVIANYNTDLLDGDSALLGVQVESSTGEVSKPEFIELTTIEVGTGELQVSVSWDTQTDVDLVLIEPDGTRIDFEFPRSAAGGVLDLDSNPACSIDNVNNENITYEGSQPPSGEYVVAVSYFSDCDIGSQLTNYVVTVRNTGSVSTYTGTLSDPGQEEQIATIIVR